MNYSPPNPNVELRAPVPTGGSPPVEIRPWSALWILYRVLAPLRVSVMRNYNAEIREWSLWIMYFWKDIYVRVFCVSKTKCAGSPTLDDTALVWVWSDFRLRRNMYLIQIFLITGYKGYTSSFKNERLSSIVRNGITNRWLFQTYIITLQFQMFSSFI